MHVPGSRKFWCYFEGGVWRGTSYSRKGAPGIVFWWGEGDCYGTPVKKQSLAASCREQVQRVLQAADGSFGGVKMVLRMRSAPHDV